MAKPNYSYEKRQRELAKKQKKELKAKERTQRKAGEGGDDGVAETPTPGDAPPPAGMPQS